MGKAWHYAVKLCLNLLLLARVRVTESVLLPSDMVLKSISLVLTDDGFKVPSPRAVQAVETASELIPWCVCV